MPVYIFKTTKEVPRLHSPASKGDKPALPVKRRV